MRFFFVSMFVTGLFFNATFHTTLPLTSSFLVSLAVQFLCVSRLYVKMCVYVYMYVCVCENVYVCMCVVCVCMCGVCVSVYVYVCVYL